MDTRFPLNSRYHGIGGAHLRRPNGTDVAYLLRRFVPAPTGTDRVELYSSARQTERIRTRAEAAEVAPVRLDNVAMKFLGDPELYWRICDANWPMRPRDLENPNLVIRIPRAEGMMVRG